jgi:hypothetical protein
MMCPYLREGSRRSHCVAYLGNLLEPSCYEEEYLCRTCLHTMCVWYVSKARQERESYGLCPVLGERLMDDPEILDSQLSLN